MIFPMVTGIKLTTIILYNVMDEDALYSAATAGSNILMSQALDNKYILATECSKPKATKAVIGNMMAKNLIPSTL